MPVTRRFRPAWWLPGAHLQTLFPPLFRNRTPPPLRRERIELEDGDFVDIDWTEARPGPTVLILHGLEGSIGSHYVVGLLHALSASGFSAAVLYFRGCSGEPNRLPRSYHSGDTGDLARVVDHINERTAGAVRAAIGFSLGGNVLLKYLGEEAESSALEAAAVLSHQDQAIQLRYLQTLTIVAAENNSTTLFPIPIDLMKPFMEKMAK